MARDPETIERDIEHARNNLASTLDQLGTKANPQRLADSAKKSVANVLSEPKVKFSLIGVAVVVGALVIRKLVR